ncbi:hypothetical protein Tco_0455519 [Tanacetum coccineum]
MLLHVRQDSSLPLVTYRNAEGMCIACVIIIANVIPPDHVPAIPEPVLVDEDDDLEEEEFEWRDRPQEEKIWILNDEEI